MLQQICELLEREYGINKTEISPESELISELGLTSFQLVEMCAQIEEEYGIEIDDDVLPTIISVQDVVDTLDKLVRKPQ